MFLLTGPYHAFAGRACTRGVTLPSLQEEDISDDASDFTQAQLQKREEWTNFFLKKYVKVGSLNAINVTSFFPSHLTVNACSNRWAL
jgi:hypothetical protein